MSGRGMVGAAMAILEAREAFDEARAAQRELVESEVVSAVGRMARETLRRANEERLARALQWLGAHLLDALESGQGAELVKVLGGEALAPGSVDLGAQEVQDEVEGADRTQARTEVGEDRGPKSLQVTAEVVADLQRRLRENQGGAKAATARPVAPDVGLVPADGLPLAVANALIQAGRVLGPTPLRLSSGNAIEDEVKRLEEALRVTLVHWGAAGKKVDHALTSWVAARARAAQEAVKALLGEARARQIGPRIDTIISGLGRHTKETWPGTVHGLARDHRPRGEDWSVDAATWERKARKLLPHEAIVDEGEDEAVASGSVDDRLRSLWEALRAGRDRSELVSELWQMVVQDGAIGRGDARLVGFVRELAERAEDPVASLAELGLGSLGLGEVERVVRDELTEDAETERRALPTDWPGFAVTRGVAAALVGGVPRPSRVEALKRCFGFGTLEWIPNACDRPLESIVQRMRSGSLQLVIVLSQLVSHNASDRLFAARDAGCRVVLADSYGVGQIRLALERFAASAIG